MASPHPADPQHAQPRLAANTAATRVAATPTPSTRQVVFAESQDDAQIIERVAALDVGKAEVVCCVRLPAPGGKTRRVQEVSTHSTMVGSLSELANRLVELGVTRVVMEATSAYWRPPFYLFEAHGLDPWLVNAKDVKHLPGRPKTDVLEDAREDRAAGGGVRRVADRDVR